MRGAWALGLAAVLVWAGSTAAFEDPHGVGYNGHDWKAMSEQARYAYVAGFLAGTAAQQALDRHRAEPKASVDAAVEEITRTHTGAFPYGANVYASDLDDYYFYRNNLSVPIYRALINENAVMRKGSGSK